MSFRFSFAALLRVLAVFAFVTPTVADGPARSPNLDNPLAARALEEFPATRERPLFSPARRPPAPPGPPPVAQRPAPPPPPPPSVTLLGIVMDETGSRAIAKVGSAGEPRQLRLGDEVGGWKVDEIGARHLILANGNRIHSVTLFRNAAKPAPGTPPAAQGRRVDPQGRSVPSGQPPGVGASAPPQ